MLIVPIYRAIVFAVTEETKHKGNQLAALTKLLRATMCYV